MCWTPQKITALPLIIYYDRNFIIITKSRTMKKIVLIAAVALCFTTMQSNAQYVRTKPGWSINLSIGNRPQPPAANYIWVEPEWQWRGGRYVEVPGHWVAPAPRRRGWVQGSWQYNKRRGYRWREGHWQRSNQSAGAPEPA